MSDNQQKDLSYYEANPDEMGDLSIEEIEALHATDKETVGQNPQGDTASSKTPDATTPSEESGREGEKEDQLQKADEPIGVSTRDGKEIIPYKVLEGVRQAKSALEKMVREQADEIARLKAQAEGGSDPANEQSTTDYMLTEDQLADVEAELPTLGAALRAERAHIKKLEEAVQMLVAEREQNRRTEAERVQLNVQEAIDSTPKLAYIQGHDQEAWERAVQIDTHLKTLPKWKDKPLAERFAEVVRRYEEDFEPIALPGAPAARRQAPTLSPTKLSATTHTGPTTMSDLPGGGTPVTDEVAALEQMSPLQATSMFERFTPEQFEAWLMRVS